MKPITIPVESMEEALRQLMSCLGSELLGTGLVSIEQWNEKIAPRLKAFADLAEGSTIHARTFRQHESVWPTAKRPA